MKKFIAFIALAVVLALPCFVEACHRARSVFVQRERSFGGFCGARQVFFERTIIRSRGVSSCQSGLMAPPPAAAPEKIKAPEKKAPEKKY